MSSNLFDLYRQLDVLKLVQAHGLSKALSVYFLGSIGSICLIISVLLLAFNQQGIQQDYNNQIINQVSAWNYQNKVSAILESQYQMTISDFKDNLIQKEIKLQMIQMADNQDVISKSLGLLSENQNKEIIIPTAYHQASIKFAKTKHLKNKQINEMCLNIDVLTSNQKIWYPVKGFTNCGSQKKSGVQFKRQRLATLTVQEMQLQGVCIIDQCEQACLNARGIFKSNACDAKYYVSEICIVTNVKDDTRVFQIQGGCFDGKIEKLSLIDKGEVLVTVRDSSDPYLQMIKLSQDGSKSNTIQQEPHVLLARTIFSIGAFCFLLSTILMYIIITNISLIYSNTNRKSMDIELQPTQLNRQEQSQVEMSQMVTQRQVPLNY